MKKCFLAVLIFFGLFPGVVRAQSVPDMPMYMYAYPVTGTDAMLNWTATDPDGAPITDFVVAYSTDQANWTEIDTQSTNQFYDLTGLQPVTTYYFKVKAVN